MNAPEDHESNHSGLESMKAIFTEQKSAFGTTPYPSAQQRIESLRKLKAALLSNQDKIATAINADFSSRSEDETRLAEVMTSVEGINRAIKKVKQWMTPDKRHVGLLFLPAKNKVFYQPLGVVGIIVPWNYPLLLSIGPLLTAIAAGNRAMIKLSEFTPAFNTVLTTILADVFDNTEVAIIEGGVEVSTQFSKLPFDHMLFTGSTAVGKLIMAAAAKNLTPVTLELGGKSPVIIAPEANMHDAAERICFGKSLNAGQTCIAPDYVLVPKGREAEFKTEFQLAFSKMYPTLRDNNHYSAIINNKQLQRLHNLLKQAEENHAEITQINPANDMFTGTRKMPLTLVEKASDDSALMQDEIFGPILPIVSYADIDEAISYVNQRPRPLALYLFSYNKAEQEKIIKQTHSGGVTLNNTLTHIAQDDMPFGGIGASGMGHYHGHEGFLTLSKAKAVHKLGKINSGKLAYPPYGTLFHKLIYRIFIR